MLLRQPGSAAACGTRWPPATWWASTHGFRLTGQSCHGHKPRRPQCRYRGAGVEPQVLDAGRLHRKLLVQRLPGGSRPTRDVPTGAVGIAEADCTPVWIGVTFVDGNRRGRRRSASTTT